MEETSFARRTLPAFKVSDYERQQRPVKVKLKIDAAAGYRVLDEFKNHILETTEHYYIVEKQIKDREWLLTYLLGFGDRLEVLEPEEVRTAYIELLKKMLKRNRFI